MLVGLGARAVLRAMRQGRRAHSHPRSEEDHAHLHPLDHIHVRGRAMATRPLLVGVVHGLAGTGAITAAVLAELPNTAARLGAIACFGLGSILGMAAVSGAMGVPLGRLRSHPRVATGMLLAVGVTSALLGVSWGLNAAFAFSAN